jgi:uncharacterized protein
VTDDELEDLRTKARNVFVPSKPISIQTALRGRTRQLERTLETLKTPGRSVFIFGERGVGKTSLALTASYLFNTSEAEPIFLACHRRSSFGEIVSQIVRKLSALSNSLGIKVVTKEAKLTLGPLGELLHRIEERPNEHLSRLDPNLAVDLFNAATPARLRGNLVILLDELDTVTDPDTKADIAFLIKQLGDRDCSIKFIFAGIADSVEQLIQQHASASRYMATIKLERLSLDELRGIWLDGFKGLGVKCDDSFTWRAAQVSDGFAHFTHLVGLKLALRVVDDGPPFRVTASHFADAISDAVEDSEAWLKSAYDKAIQKYQDVYEPILWAAADHWELLRSTEQIYQAYCRICADMDRTPEDKRDGFYNRLYNLRQATHGPALISPRKSWYQFQQAMLRGYCRLVAQSKGVRVGIDYQSGSTPTPRTNART